MKVFVLAAIFFSSSIFTQVKITPEDALQKHFPGLKTTRVAVYLKQNERNQIAKELGGDEVSGLYTFYIARDNGKIKGYALFDTHRVRTKEETLCVVLDEKGGVKAVDLISFYEPDEYMPPARWLEKFAGKNRESLQEVQAMTGATLTSRSVYKSLQRAVVVFKYTLGK